MWIYRVWSSKFNNFNYQGPHFLNCTVFSLWLFFRRFLLALLESWIYYLYMSKYFTSCKIWLYLDSMQEKKLWNLLNLFNLASEYGPNWKVWFALLGKLTIESLRYRPELDRIFKYVLRSIFRIISFFECIFRWWT